MTRDFPETEILSFHSLSARVEAAFAEISQNAAQWRCSLEVRSQLMSQQRGTIETFRELKDRTLAYWGELHG